MSETMPWDSIYEKKLTLIPEQERDVSTTAYVHFSAFQDWLESQGVDRDMDVAASLFPVLIDAVRFGREQAEQDVARYLGLSAALGVDAAIDAVSRIFSNDAEDTEVSIGS